MIAKADILKVQAWMGHAQISRPSATSTTSSAPNEVALVADAFAIEPLVGPHGELSVGGTQGGGRGSWSDH
jgi:hypothetical protein